MKSPSPLTRSTIATRISGSKRVITDTAANVGAKPNSRKPRILTVIGTSPGRARKIDRFTSVNEWMNANTAPATTPLLISGNTMCRSASQRLARRLDVGRQRLQADADRAHRKRHADHHVADEQRREADVFAPADVLEELQQA